MSSIAPVGDAKFYGATYQYGIADGTECLYITDNGEFKGEKMCWVMYMFASSPSVRSVEKKYIVKNERIMSKFKVGDRVLITSWGDTYTSVQDAGMLGLKNFFPDLCGKNYRESRKGLKGTIVGICGLEKKYGIRLTDGTEHVFGTLGYELDYTENNNKTDMFNTFKNLFVTEPKKSYRSLGITDENDKPTQDGIDLFVSWSLNNPDISAKFVADVVTPLNAAFEEAKSKK